MARKLKTLAEYIRAKGYDVHLEPSYCSTDRKIPGTRLRSPGKGRHGQKLTVYAGDRIIFQHDSAQTYRTNSEVEDWIKRNL